ncbi:MAG: hypothetical protein ABS41_03240 [Arenimonas sp. SCN 70-307]|uniref:DUF2306 domain-containing protein n=1 Tax=Arenimonas sp. SCN 70-307 TaxID=1660089 RepID=UPI00086B0C88|nr:DUF2306 domain-containing protein [Arenimonas sp. SCN 70-307]ODS64289.1 MAG: hypothetical protein ABS41_03240 [Arenimonas sp. SCN 70-307]
MDIATLPLVLHVAAGTVALATFWTAGLVKKGTPLHRRVGQVYLLAMLAIVLTGIPLVLQVTARGQPVGALFLTYLLVLVGNASWSAWRAIRDRRDRAAYFGPMYWFVAALTAGSGLAIIALGLQTGAVLLQVFGGVGVFAGVGALRGWRRSATDPQWWLKEHYGAMIGNGVATHIAFFGIGLRGLLPGVDPQLLQHFAWFTPLAGSLVAAWWLGRKYGRPVAPGQTSPSSSQPSPVPRLNT